MSTTDDEVRWPERRCPCCGWTLSDDDQHDPLRYACPRCRLIVDVEEVIVGV